MSDDVDEIKFDKLRDAQTLLKLTRIVCYPDLQTSPVKDVCSSAVVLTVTHCFQSPSTIGEEKQYNPFLRIHSAELHLALGLQQLQDEDWTQFRARVLEEVRKRKDNYNRR